MQLALENPGNSSVEYTPGLEIPVPTHWMGNRG